MNLQVMLREEEEKMHVTRRGNGDAGNQSRFGTGWEASAWTLNGECPHERRQKKYLLLQADQRLNHNREDIPQLAHLQGLYYS